MKAPLGVKAALLPGEGHGPGRRQHAVRGTLAAWRCDDRELIWARILSDHALASAFIAALDKQQGQTDAREAQVPP